MSRHHIRRLCRRLGLLRCSFGRRVPDLVQNTDPRDIVDLKLRIMTGRGPLTVFIRQLARRDASELVAVIGTLPESGFAVMDDTVNVSMKAHLKRNQRALDKKRLAETGVIDLFRRREV